MQKDDSRRTWLSLNSNCTGESQPDTVTRAILLGSVNGDVYVSDGYGNSRIVVFDRSGKFLRQWGRQGTKEEADAGVGGAFMQVVHCVALGNDGLIYVCDPRSVNLPMATLWRSIPKAMFMWPKPNGVAESKNLSHEMMVPPADKNFPIFPYKALREPLASCKCLKAQ